MSYNCDQCINYIYDEEYDEYCCSVDMDEDDYGRMLSSNNKDQCPYFRFGDEYSIVRKQN